MNIKSTIILVVGTVLLGGSIVFFERRVQTSEEVSEDQFRLLQAFAPKAVEQIVLQGENGTVHLVKEEDRWSMAKPIKDQADRGRVEGLLDTLKQMDFAGRIEPEAGKPLDLARYGLKQPKQKLIIRYGARTVSVAMGRDWPGGGKVYARIGERPEVLVLPDEFKNLLARDTNFYRNRKVFDIDPNKVGGVLLIKSPLQIQIQRQTTGPAQWQITAPISDRADPGKIDSLLAAAGGMEIDRFVDEDPKDPRPYGFSREKATAVALTQGGVQQYVLIGGVAAQKEGKDKGKHFYAKRKETPAVFTVKAADVEKFTFETRPLRDPHLFPGDVAEAQAIEQIRTGKNWRLVKKDEVWNMEKPKSFKADMTLVKTFLDNVKTIRAVDFVDQPNLAALGLDKAEPALSMTFSATKPQTCLIGKTVPGKKKDDPRRVYVKLASDSAVRVVKAETLDEVTKSYLDFYGRQMLTFKTSDVVKVEVIRPGRTYQAIKKDGKWMLEKPIATAADSGNLSNILWDLNKLKADKIVADDDSPETLKTYALDQPQYTVKIGLKDKSAHTLFVSVKETQPYARVDGKSFVFTVGQSLVDDLGRELCKLDVFDLSEAPRALTIVRGNTTETLTKKDDKFFLTVGKSKPKKVQKKSAEALLSSLRWLRAAKFVAFEVKDFNPYGLAAPSAVVSLSAGEKKAIIELGKKTPSGLFARRQGERKVLQLKAADAEKFGTLMRFLPGKPAGNKPGKKD